VIRLDKENLSIKQADDLYRKYKLRLGFKRRGNLYQISLFSSLKNIKAGDNITNFPIRNISEPQLNFEIIK